MELKEIKTKKCPFCGCTEVVAESSYSKHTCGMWNEERKFRCGLTIHFSPNFDREETTGECTVDPEYKTKVKKRIEAREKLVRYIDKMDTDQSFKDRIIYSIKYVN